MLKLDAITADDLREKISKDDFLDNIIEDVKNKMARVLASDTAVGVIKIFKDEKNKIELFISALQGRGGRQYMKELIEFAKQNKIDAIGLQTRRQGLLHVVMNRFDFKFLGTRDGYFQLRREITL